MVDFWTGNIGAGSVIVTVVCSIDTFVNISVDDTITGVSIVSTFDLHRDWCSKCKWMIDTVSHQSGLQLYTCVDNAVVEWVTKNWNVAFIKVVTGVAIRLLYLKRKLAARAICLCVGGDTFSWNAFRCFRYIYSLKTYRGNVYMS